MFPEATTLNIQALSDQSRDRQETEALRRITKSPLPEGRGSDNLMPDKQSKFIDHVNPVL